MKKKSILFILMSMLVLAGCSSTETPKTDETVEKPETEQSSTVSVEIAEKFDAEAIKAVLVKADQEVVAGGLTDDSQIAAFANDVEGANAYNEVRAIIHEQMVKEKGHMNAAYFGTLADEKVDGVTVIVFPRFIDVDEALVSAAASEANIYVYKNVFVSVSEDFVSDVSVIFDNLDSFLPEVKTK